MSDVPMPIDAAATQATIEAVAANFRRWNGAGMFDSAAAVLTEDHYSMPPNHPAISGRSNWLAWAESALAGGTLTDEPVAGSRRYTITDSLAIETGGYVLSFTPAQNAPPTVRAFSDTGKYLWQWRRIAGGWQLATAIWNSDLPPRP
jgi:ketosteroid isomerase-like protein